MCKLWWADKSTLYGNQEILTVTHACLRYVRRPESLQRLCIWQHCTAWISRKLTIRRCHMRCGYFLSLSRRYFVDVFCIARCLEGCSKMFKVPFQISKFKLNMYTPVFDIVWQWVLICSDWFCKSAPGLKINKIDTHLGTLRLRTKHGNFPNGIHAVRRTSSTSCWKSWGHRLEAFSLSLELEWFGMSTSSHGVTSMHVASRCQVRHGKTW